MQWSISQDIHTYIPYIHTCIRTSSVRKKKIQSQRPIFISFMSRTMYVPKVRYQWPWVHPLLRIICFITIVLAIFLIAKTKYPTPKVRGGKVYLAHSLQRLQAGSKSGGIAERNSPLQVENRKSQRANSDKPLSISSYHNLSPSNLNPSIAL